MIAMPDMQDGFLLGIIVLVAVALFAGQSISQRARKSDRRVVETSTRHPNQPVFLFDGTKLLDASPSGLQLISGTSDAQSDFDGLQHVLRRDFPNLSQEVRSLAPNEERRLVTMNGSPLLLDLSNQSGLIRIALGTTDGHDVDAHYAALARAAAGEELELLRDIQDHTPHLMWRIDRHGSLTWANKAYLAYVDQRMGDPDESEKVLPGGLLFDLPPKGGLSGKRISLQINPKAGEHWFEVSSRAFGDEITYHATNINALVRAENTRRDLMQTLSKTFAELSVALAIFDSKRHLVMFNPALLDMTGLPFDFLSAHPTIDSFLNRLRDMRKLPEPKNYASWREQFLTLEAEAKRGTYSENWTLPDGQTIRVTGRPHPDGALAFVFEDISAEVSLTRHFRSEIDTSQSVIDAIDDAIAVFSSANTLVLTNRAYRALWNTDTESDLITLDFRAVLRTWKSATAPSPVWPRLEAFSHTFETRKKWSENVTFVDGRQAICHATPLPSRMTMIRFEMRSEGRAALQKLVQNDIHTAKVMKQ